MSSAFKADDASPVPVLQPTSMKLNLSSVACVKNVDDGIATTVVSMPTRLSICATACAILASLT